jgi:glycosyltransferase involved in cell wall biosynthesis
VKPVHEIRSGDASADPHGESSPGCERCGDECVFDRQKVGPVLMLPQRGYDVASVASNSSFCYAHIEEHSDHPVSLSPAMTGVSIVITTHNRLALLKDAVDSVRRATDWEVVVVDDASEDGTWEWLTEVSDERLAAIRNDENRNRGHSRNRGLGRAAGEFVLFLDDDDRVRADGLTKLVRKMEHNPDAVAGIGRHIVFDDHGRARGSRLMLPHKKVLWPEVLAGWTISGGQVLMRRSAASAAGGFDEEVVTGEDTELFLRVALLGPVVVTPWPIHEHRTHGDQWHRAQGRMFYDTRRAYRRRFVAALPAVDRDLGVRCLEAWERRLMARHAYRRGRCAEALRDYIWALRRAHEAFLTPLWFPQLTRDLFKCTMGAGLGRRAFAEVQKKRARARSLLARDPGTPTTEAQTRRREQREALK